MALLINATEFNFCDAPSASTAHGRWGSNFHLDCDPALGKIAVRDDDCDSSSWRLIRICRTETRTLIVMPGGCALFFSHPRGLGQPWNFLARQLSGKALVARESPHSSWRPITQAGPDFGPFALTRGKEWQSLCSRGQILLSWCGHSRKHDEERGEVRCHLYREWKWLATGDVTLVLVTRP